MKEQLQNLNVLLENISSAHSSKCFSEIDSVLNKYTKILDFVNGYNETYKRATSVYYKDINSIRDNIQDALYGNSIKQKDTAFQNARNELKKDIQALAMLIKPTEELVELSA